MYQTLIVVLQGFTVKNLFHKKWQVGIKSWDKLGTNCWRYLWDLKLVLVEHSLEISQPNGDTIQDSHKSVTRS